MVKKSTKYWKWRYWSSREGPLEVLEYIEILVTGAGISLLFKVWERSGQFVSFSALLKRFAAPRTLCENLPRVTPWPA
eukprot:947430-Prymnesium_polylepis.1